ncbi:MAG: SIMPL domain-containing protein [Bacteroidota bacterium]
MKKLILIVFLSYSSFAQNGIIEVEGSGKSSAIPEEIVVNIPVQVEESSYSECSKTLIKKIESLKKSLRRIDLSSEEVKTGNLNVRENYVYENGKRKKKGYIGSLNIQITDKYDSKKLGKIVSILEDDKYQFGYNTNFQLSEEQKNSLNKEAITRAVKDAKTKAGILSNAAEVSLDGILKIEYVETEGYPIYRPSYRQAESLSLARSDAQVELDPTEADITRKVKITFKMK